LAFDETLSDFILTYNVCIFVNSPYMLFAHCIRICGLSCAAFRSVFISFRINSYFIFGRRVFNQIIIGSAVTKNSDCLNQEHLFQYTNISHLFLVFILKYKSMFF
jgi:hypothetical protein